MAEHTGKARGINAAAKQLRDLNMDNESYYDEFAGWYERERGAGYHKMLDDIELSCIERYGRDKDILEAGCGTGLLMARATRFARSIVGIDLSSGMLEKAKERGLDVVQGSVTELPYEDGSFDLVYSMKVLPHIEDIQGALSEMARVTRPGGTVLAEFYNPRSLRYLVKSLKSPTAISTGTTDNAVYTRYDTPTQFREYIPKELVWQDCAGVRVITPVAAVHKVPGLGSAIRYIEHRLAPTLLACEFAGFVIAILRRT